MLLSFIVFDPLRLYHSIPHNMMWLGDGLLCPSVAVCPREKAPRWVCRLRQTAQVEHGEVAFATAMCPPIDSDGERLATDVVCSGSKMRNTRKGKIISAFPRLSRPPWSGH